MDNDSLHLYFFLSNIVIFIKINYVSNGMTYLNFWILLLLLLLFDRST